MAQTLGEQLRWLRQNKGLSLDQLASAAGISRAYLWKLERTPGVNPSVDLLEKLAGALGTSLTELLPTGTSDQGEAVEIPEALRECQKTFGLSEADVQDLARIRFRGRRPTTADDWGVLFLNLKRAVSDEGRR